MKTAVIYARYSSDSQTEQSIEGQLRVCEDYAAKNGIIILDTYIDRAMTGTNDNRPDFRRMIADSAKREWNYVLVYKLDRFSRDKYETAIHKKTLKNNGVKVISATEYIPDAPEGILFESIIEGYAAFYSAELSQKIRRGNNESRHKGNLTGGKVPYGYKNENKKAVIVEEQAEVVRYIFEQYSVGVYVKDIIDELTKRGITYFGKKFVKNTVYKILRNERYSGIYHYNGEAFDNIYPRIVPQDVFDKVREKINANKYGKQSTAATFILRHKAVCGYCGQAIFAESGTARNGEKKYYYNCLGRKHGTCHKTAIRKDILESIVIDNVVQALSDKRIIDSIVKGIMQMQEQQENNNLVLSILQKELRQTETAIANIMSAIEQGIVTKTTASRLKECEQKQEDLQRQILIEQSKTVVKLSEREVRQFYSQALHTEPQMLINMFVKQIVLFDDKIEIHYNSPIEICPDESRGFSFYTNTERFTVKVPQREKPIRYEITINMLI